MPKRKSIPRLLVSEIEVSLLFQVHGLTENAGGERLQEFGIQLLPDYGKSRAGDNFELLSNGPGMWLAQSQTREVETTLIRLREVLAETSATVTDLSSARQIVQVSGAASREFLKKGCPIDIDSLRTGDVVSTIISHLGVTIHCRNDDFVLYVLQSFGTDFWEWCRHNAMEFNI